MQIYNEAISDLLKDDRLNLSIREDARKGVYVHRLSEWVVRSPMQVYELMAKGARLAIYISFNSVSSVMFLEGNWDYQHERSQQQKPCHSQTHR